VRGARLASRGLALLAAMFVNACVGHNGDIISGSGGSGSGAGGTGNGGGSNDGGAGNTPSAATSLELSCPTAPPGSPLLRLLTRNELQSTLDDIFPSVKGQWTSSLPASTISAFGFDNDGASTVGNQMASALLDAATSLATALTGSGLATLLPCSTSSPNHACAQTFLQTYGPRLFRRPLTNAEQTSYLSFFDTSLGKSSFTSALKWMTVGLIQSPNAVYRSEIGTAQADGTRQLSSYEVATELAYTYSGSTPTSALLTMAGNGSLGDLAAAARTLIATDPGKAAMQHFFEQYFEYSTAPSLQKPNIASFAQVSNDMISETQDFIDQIVFQNAGGLADLLTAPSTNPSKALAAYYATGNDYSGGFPVPSTDYAQVTRPTGLGIGILSQGAFLATHASSTASSPTKRGLFPFYKLFCSPKLTPPPNVPPIDTTTVTATVHTTRDRYELVHELTDGPTGSCAGCHVYFDPIGFASEHFDEGGRFRVMEGTYPINSADSVMTPAGSATLTFTDEEDLMNDLVGQPIIHQCVEAYLATFAYGSTDACIGSSPAADLQSGKIGLAEAFAQLADEPHFTTRTAQ
jgi:hypothetical protein